jgi:Putative MetA-pathway of phenol degradation
VTSRAAGARRLTFALLAAAVWCFSTGPAAAQQPFLVDDADVTPARGWHVELSSQADILRPAARPARWQNVFEWEVNYGAGRRIELAALLPVVTLVSDAAGGRTSAHGVGDSTLAAKWRLTRDLAARHATALTATLEIPSGSRARGLGTGLVDYGLNLVSQHQVHPRATLRVNGGALLAGNTQSGAVGIRERGTVLTTGASLVTPLTSALQLGGELTMAWSQKASLAGSAIGWQIGTNVTLRQGVTLDASVLGGWFDASPRVGVQVGMSADLR